MIKALPAGRLTSVVAHNSQTYHELGSPLTALTALPLGRHRFRAR
jgi:hypothetical protein